MNNTNDWEKELEEQIGYILYKLCATCTDDGLCEGTMELRRRIMDKISQLLSKRDKELVAIIKQQLDTLCQ